MKQFVKYLKNYSGKEKQDILESLKRIKTMRKEQIKILKGLVEQYKLDLKRIEMVKQNELPLKAVLRTD